MMYNGKEMKLYNVALYENINQLTSFGFYGNNGLQLLNL